jgi:hypothetical protein
MACVRLRFSQRWLWRMPSSGMWRCVDLVGTDVSEEADSSLANFATLEMEAMRSFETSVHTRSIHRHIQKTTFFIELELACLTYYFSGYRYYKNVVLVTELFYELEQCTVRMCVQCRATVAGCLMKAQRMWSKGSKMAGLFVTRNTWAWSR